MARRHGAKLGNMARAERYVQIAHERGLLEQRGAKTELARIMNVTRGYINIMLRRVEARDAARNRGL